MERLKREREEEEAKMKEEVASKGTEGAKGAEGTGGFIASKTGKKYYAAGSAAAEKIKEENRVSFKTEDEAKTAGYEA